MERCLTSLAIRRIQIKTIINQCTLIRAVIYFFNSDIVNAGEVEKTLFLIHFWSKCRIVLPL